MKKAGDEVELSPFFYHSLVRPKWISHIYIHNKIENHLNLKDKQVLDFGAGTGANCALCHPSRYVGIDPDEKRISYAKRVYPDYVFDVFRNDTLPVKDHSLDIILIVAVLHHIPKEKLVNYVKKFRQALKKRGGRIVAIEPCLLEGRSICNWFMKTNDNGKYIQHEEGYYQFFKKEGFRCRPIQKFRKCFFYHEIFFEATLD